MADVNLILVIVVASVYTCITILLLIGVRRQQISSKSAADSEPFVSILIAARNEEKHIPELFSSLQNLKYPHDAFEIIFVDDHSTDKTRTLANAYSKKLGNLTITCPAEKLPDLNGKANALLHAMRLAKGQIIFITDADCRVPPDWIVQHLRYYEPDTAMVGGVTTLQNKPPTARYFYHLQAQDWLYLLCTGCSTAAWGLPFSIVGNNLSFRRNAYDLTGGFANLGATVVEDYALMQAFKKKALPIKMVADAAMVVTSNPAEGLQEFIVQRKRWAAGAKTMGLLAKILLIIGYLSKILPVVFLLAGEWGYGSILTGTIFFCDTRLIYKYARVTSKFHLRKYAWFYPLFAIFTFIILLPPMLYSKKIEWKGRKYQV